MRKRPVRRKQMRWSGKEGAGEEKQTRKEQMEEGADGEGAEERANEKDTDRGEAGEGEEMRTRKRTMLLVLRIQRMVTVLIAVEEGIDVIVTVLLMAIGR